MHLCADLSHFLHKPSPPNASLCRFVPFPAQILTTRYIFVQNYSISCTTPDHQIYLCADLSHFLHKSSPPDTSLCRITPFPAQTHTTQYIFVQIWGIFGACATAGGLIYIEIHNTISPGLYVLTQIVLQFGKFIYQDRSARRASFLFSYDFFRWATQITLYVPQVGIFTSFQPTFSKNLTIFIGIIFK